MGIISQWAAMNAVSECCFTKAVLMPGCKVGAEERRRAGGGVEISLKFDTEFSLQQSDFIILHSFKMASNSTHF